MSPIHALIWEKSATETWVQGHPTDEALKPLRIGVKTPSFQARALPKSVS